jgi:hypothetical protein
MHCCRGLPASQPANWIIRSRGGRKEGGGGSLSESAPRGRRLGLLALRACVRARTDGCVWCLLLFKLAVVQTPMPPLAGSKQVMTEQGKKILKLLPLSVPRYSGARFDHSPCSKQL